MSDIRKYKIGDKLLVPLLKNKDGTNGAPMYSIRNSDVSNFMPGKADFIELEICGTYSGNYQGINSPYLFKIPSTKMSYFKMADTVLGTKYADLTPDMQRATVLTGSHQDLFYAIEKDAVDQVCQAINVKTNPNPVSTTLNNNVSDKFVEKQSSTKDQTQMSNTKTPGQIFKSDLEKSAYRVAARQSAKVAKNAILTVVKSKNSDKRKANKAVSAVEEILDTDLGTYGVSEALGWMLTYAPGLKEHPRAQQLAEELRVEGLAGAGDLAFDKILQTLVPSMVSVLNSLPAVEKETTKQIESQEKTEVAQQEVELEVVTLSAQSSK